MLSEFINPLYTAFLLFPVLALVFTVPYLVHQYRKYGSVVVFRGVVVYSFILYLLCIYFLVILPLPSFAQAASGTGPIVQLHPLQCLRDILAVEGFSPKLPGTYRLLLHDGDFKQIVLNFAMFLPLGFYLRYYFKRNWFETILISFGLSLFFELTQVTALYGIYPRPYRLFDVDDLLINTAGGFVGHIFAPLLYWILPKKETLDAVSYARGEKISIFRRILAAGIDWLILGVIATLLSGLLGINDVFLLTWGTAILYIVLVFLYFVVFTWLFHGRTVGKAIMKLQICDDKGRNPGFTKLCIRYGILYGLCVPSLFLAIQLNRFSYTVAYSWAVTILVGIFATIFFVFLIQGIMTVFKDDRGLIHEKFSHTQTESLINSQVH
ncbi:MAG: VanZ family protein [Clostridiales bacterium]